MIYDSDEDFNTTISNGTTHTEEAIAHIRNQYDSSLKNLISLEEQIAQLQYHRYIPVTKYTQCTESLHMLHDVACQTDTLSPETDDRFYQRVDDIVNQNKQLHHNIVTLQRRLEELDSSRNTLSSDFNLKHSEALEKLRILQSKREESYHGRINLLDDGHTTSLCSVLDSFSSSTSGRVDDSRAFNISHLLDLDKDELIAKQGTNILTRIENSIKSALLADSPTSQELHKIRFEKETALKKCVKLDFQLANVKKTKEELLEQINKLEEELQSLRLFYNLHQSLSQEASLRDQYNTQVSDLAERLKQRETELLASQCENDALAAMIKRFERRLAQVSPLHNGLPGHHYKPSSPSRGSKQLSSSSSISSQM